ALLAAGADEEVRLRELGQRQRGGDALGRDRVRRQLAPGHLAGQHPAGLGDVPATAVVGGDVEVQAAIAGGGLFRPRHALLQLGGEGAAFADEAQPHAAARQLVHFAVEGAHEQLHQCAHFLLRPLPVLAREREQRERLDAAPEAVVDAEVDRARAGTVADAARAVAALGPAAVAVHDDGQVARKRGLGPGSGHGRSPPGRRPQIAISSSSLAFTTWSTSLTKRSVSAWMSCSARRSSSSVICLSLSSSLTWCRASRRMLRTATLAFSPSWPTCLDSSLRRSSVSGGRLMRMTVPAVLGVSPRSEPRMAFSTGPTMDFS